MTSGEPKRQKRNMKPRAGGETGISKPITNLALVSEEPEQADPKNITAESKPRQKGKDDPGAPAPEGVRKQQMNQASEDEEVAAKPAKLQNRRQPQLVGGDPNQARQPKGTPSEDETVKKKKRRKINVFPTAPEPTVFDFTQQVSAFF